MRDRWKSDLHKFQEEVNRLVEQSLNRIGNYWTADGDLRPVTDLYDMAEELMLFVELPGLVKDDVSITIVGRSLVISAEKKRPAVDEEKLKFGERHFGRYHRSYDLTCDVEVDKIAATFVDGVLQVKIPKVTESAQKIEIKIG